MFIVAVLAPRKKKVLYDPEAAPNPATTSSIAVPETNANRKNSNRGRNSLVGQRPADVVSKKK
jgi:hypothetical protein